MKPIKIVCLLLTLANVPARSQQTAGSIVGTLSDPSGAVNPNVEMTVTNVNTNTIRRAVTDNSGNYTVPFLVAGTYRIGAAAKGFRQKAVDSVVVQVGQTVRVDLQLEVGDAAQTVEVQAAATTLQTENATVGAVIDAQKIVNLPLNGRNFIQLAQLVPGVQ